MNKLIPAPDLPDEDMFEASVGEALRDHLDGLDASRDQFEEEDKPHKRSLRISLVIAFVYVIAISIASNHYSELALLAGWVIHAFIMVYITIRQHKVLDRWIARDSGTNNEWEAIKGRMQQTINQIIENTRAASDSAPHEEG